MWKVTMLGNVEDTKMRYTWCYHVIHTFVFLYVFLCSLIYVYLEIAFIYLFVKSCLKALEAVHYIVQITETHKTQMVW